MLKKFICYIKINGDNFSRITFSISRLSDTEFIATPVQNTIGTTIEKFPVIYISRNNTNWEYKFENNQIWLTDDKVRNIISCLVEKIGNTTRELEIKRNTSGTGN